MRFTSLMRTRVRGWALVLALLLAAVPAGADVFEVTHAGDSGEGSLFQAVQEANARDGAHTINVTKGLGVISVSSEMTFSSGSTVTVYGNGVTLKGNGTSRLFRITDGEVVFERITFTGGAALSGNGGAVEIDGANAYAEFNNCTFFDNDASGSGGAVCVTQGHADHATVFQHCTIAGNSASDGGGVAVLKGPASIRFSIVVGNAVTGGAGVDASGSINGSWNVLGKAYGFSSNENSLAGQTAEAVFLKNPPEMETVDDAQVLRLANASPARDLIPTGTAGALTVDQRGASRPQMTDIDAGAFEVSSVPLLSADVTGPVYVMMGSSATYSVDVYPDDASLNDSTYPGGVEWIVGSADVLSVDVNGKAEALTESESTLTARVHGWDADGNAVTRDTPSITVYTGDSQPVVTLRIDPELPDYDMVVNTSADIKPEVKMTLNGQEVTQLPYSVKAGSNNLDVVSTDVIDGKRVRLTARALGTAVISVSADVSFVTNTGAQIKSSEPDEFTVKVTASNAGSRGGGGCDAGIGALALVLCAWALRARPRP